jgi:hypothetical protein
MSLDYGRESSFRDGDHLNVEPGLALAIALVAASTVRPEIFARSIFSLAAATCEEVTTIRFLAD